VVSGLAVARAIARQARIRCRLRLRDGSAVRRGTIVLELWGDARRILAVERTLLNYLMHLSGVATQTALAVRQVRGTRTRILGTRKTIPGLRELEKQAIVHGGGAPNRRDLSDALLVKNNHLALVPLRVAVERAVARGPAQIEVRTAAQAATAIRAGARSLLIDNATPRQARRILQQLESKGLRRGVVVELSGGITPENARGYARTGANALSLGSITHSATALPFHLTIAPA
jgi:nicotinate-nucleotide pyrophosphorylase (carboxylating)